jgi:hypothetical protein
MDKRIGGYMKSILKTPSPKSSPPRRGLLAFTPTDLRTIVWPIQPLVSPHTLRAFLPLLGGEGRGEEAV